MEPRSRSARLLCRWALPLIQIRGSEASPLHSPIVMSPCGEMGSLVRHAPASGRRWECQPPTRAACPLASWTEYITLTSHPSSEYTKRMRKKQANATTIRLEQADREAIARIRELYGCPSDSAAIKLAVRLIARGNSTPVPKPQTRNGHSSPA
jgi:hypothetical protein